MAVVTVHISLPQLSTRLLLLTVATVAVAVMSRRCRPLAVLLVVPVILVVAMSVLFGAAVRLNVIRVSRSSLGVVQGLEVVVVVVVDDAALWHHLQVGAHTVVANTCIVAEVDDTALVGALVGWLDPGEAKFMGNVASYNLHNLVKINKNRRRKVRSYR